MTVKEKILHVALDFFSQKGYTATTLDEIAEAAGMKAPNIYNYFKDKEDILRNIHLIADEPYQGLIGYDQKMPIWIHNGDELKQYTKYHVNHTITNETIVKLRKLCTIEQFKYDELAEKMSAHQYDLINALYERDLIIKYDGDEELMCEDSTIIHDYKKEDLPSFEYECENIRYRDENRNKYQLEKQIRNHKIVIGSYPTYDLACLIKRYLDIFYNQGTYLENPFLTQYNVLCLYK